MLSTASLYQQKIWLCWSSQTVACYFLGFTITLKVIHIFLDGKKNWNMGEEHTQHLQSFNSWEGKIERCSQQKEMMQPGHSSPLRFYSRWRWTWRLESLDPLRQKQTTYRRALFLVWMQLGYKLVLLACWKVGRKQSICRVMTFRKGTCTIYIRKPNHRAWRGQASLQGTRKDSCPWTSHPDFVLFIILFLGWCSARANNPHGWFTPLPCVYFPLYQVSTSRA